MEKTIKAFSLAEMMVVMLILSLVLAASMPIMTRRVHSRTEDAIPFGAIIIWHGSVASIPSGWVLCNGSNGTPDLRSRFVYGAGGDTNTKASLVNGWDAAANGHWQVGHTGGEETHVLTVAEMPTHAHTGSTDTQGNHNHSVNDPGHTHSATVSNYTDYGGNNWFAGNRDVGNNGTSNQISTNLSNVSINAAGNHVHGLSLTNNGGGGAHYTMPRLMVLAYIMKL